MNEMSMMGLFFKKSTKKQKVAIINTLKAIKLCSNKIISNDTVFIELCPYYVSKCGSSKYVSYKVFPIVTNILCMTEINKTMAKDFGLKVRGKRTGKFFAIDIEDYNGSIEFLHSISPEEPSNNSWRQIRCKPQLIKAMPQGRSFKVVCPYHNDKSPSMVVWMNKGQNTGGGQCMVCFNKKGSPLTVKIKYENEKLYACNFLLDKNRNNIKPCIVKWHALPSYLQCVSKTSLVGAYLKPNPNGLFRTIGHRLKKKCLMSALLYSDKLSMSERHINKAKDHALYFGDMPMKFPVISVSDMCVRYSENKFIGWKPISQNWLLFDFDKIIDFKYKQSLLRDLVSIVKDSNLSGEFCIVRTSKKGIHFWLEMKYKYKKPIELFSLPEVRSWYSYLGENIQDALSRCSTSSILDMSSCAGGRYARRPSWRSEEELFRTKVIAHTV